MKCPIHNLCNLFPGGPGFNRLRFARVIALLLLVCGSFVSGWAAVFNFNPPVGTASGSFGGGVVTLTRGGQNPTNIASTSANDLTSANGVVAWSSGSTIYSYVFDPAKGIWIGSTTSQGPTFDLSTTDGVVAWSTSSGVFYRVYDPIVGNWISGNGAGPISEPRLLNSGGVVAWSRGNTVTFSVYDPTRNGWRNANGPTSGSTFDLTTGDGIVAWSVNPRVDYQIYDPRLGSWRGGTTNSGFTGELTIQNSVVSWISGTSTLNRRGYNGTTGAWAGTPTALAWFAVSTNSGNAPFYVSFIDMSIGGISWLWNFGDGSGTSSRRSPIYQYTTFGRFSVSLSVNGSSTTNQFIVTDTIPPVGTNLINNGAPFTSNAVVTLSLSAADNSGLVTSMRFSNEGTNWSNWEAFAPNKTWMLSSGNGSKIVSAQFRDSASNTSANANATIYLDSTTLPVVSLVSTNVGESADTVTALVLLDHPYSQRVSIRYTTASGTAGPADYTHTTGLLHFPSNVTSATITVPIISDGLPEVNETVLIVFSDATNAVAGQAGTITILDDDPAGVAFAAANFNASEADGAATITVALTAPSGLPVTVQYTATNGIATPGLDFTPVQGLLTFAPGQITQTFTVPLIDESLDELAETVDLVLFNSTNAMLGAPAQATLTILDDDNPVVFFTSSQYAASETSGVVRASVRLSKPFSQAVSVDYAVGGGTATPGEDYPGGVSGITLLFQPGQTNKDISVTILNDTRAEPTETIHLVLSDFFNVGPGPVIEADIVINDDDGAPVMLSPTITAGQQFQVTFQGKTGQRFSVEASTNLPVWFPLATLTNVTGTLLFTDPTPASNRQRFYRSLVTP